MRLLSWNVNGIRAVHKRGDLDWLWSSDLDVICVQETKAQPDQVDEVVLRPEGFRSEWSWGEKRGYSGVATYVRDEHECSLMQKGLGVDALDKEGRVVATDHDAFVLFNIYFPNGGRGPDRVRFKLEFYEAFLALTEELRTQGREIVVCGDLNTAHQPIDLAEPEKNASVSGFLPEERAWVDRFLASGFIDTFRAENGDRPGQYTWWDMRTNARADNRGWRIDYFLISEGLEDCLVDAWIMPQIYGSDHCPVGLELDV